LIAKFANNFEKVAVKFDGPPPTTTVLDALTGVTGIGLAGLTGGGSLIPAAMMLARPFTRAGLLTGPGQKLAIPSQIPGTNQAGLLGSSVLAGQQ